MSFRKVMQRLAEPSTYAGLGIVAAFAPHLAAQCADAINYVVHGAQASVAALNNGAPLWQGVLAFGSGVAAVILAEKGNSE